MLIKKINFINITWVCLIAFFHLFLIASTYAGPLIKAGTVLTANLDTPLDTDAPHELITATINQGKFKGAKLAGKLSFDSETTMKGIPALQFSSIKLNGKTIKAKSITAFAIDFDEARVMSVTKPDYEELKREVIPLASTFLSAYSFQDKVKLGAGTEFAVLIMSDV